MILRGNGRTDDVLNLNTDAPVSLDSLDKCATSEREFKSPMRKGHKGGGGGNGHKCVTVDSNGLYMKSKLYNIEV